MSGLSDEQLAGNSGGQPTVKGAEHREISQDVREPEREASAPRELVLHHQVQIRNPWGEPEGRRRGRGGRGSSDL